MTGRYARAREAGGLVFGDMAGRQVVRRITGARKIPGDEPIVTLLRLNKGDPTADEDDQLASEHCQVPPPAARESR